MLLQAPYLWAVSLIGLSLSANSAAAQDQRGELQTVAESSDFRATSSSSQVEQFIRACASRAGHVNAFVFGQTVEGRDMIGVTISRQPYVVGKSNGRAVALVIGNIHSGECTGKEALLMMIRELAENPKHRWLDNLVLIFVPNYNADANDRMGTNNRPGQIGPEQGMGRRENAQDLDLNRDFVKLESPEARALVKLIDDVNPELFIDCHTTNGSKHQYPLTYDIPHNPATAEPIREFLRQKMMPEVTKRLQDEGLLTFYYGNFDALHSTWTTFGHEPRYSTEYVGLRGRLAILSEDYSYISYRDRIFATRDFVSACLDFLGRYADPVVELLNSVDNDLVRAAQRQPSRVSISLNARAEKFEDKCTLKGYRDDEPCDYECDFVGNFVSTRSIPMPYAYLIPNHMPRPVDRLLMHGIEVEQLTRDTDVSVTLDIVTDLDLTTVAFQKHRMAQVQIQRSTENRRIKQGMYVVRSSQPLGRLASYMLESESDDGLLFWNFFDRDVAPGREFPVLRVDQPALLETRPVDEVQPNTPVTLDMIGGPDSIVPLEPTPVWADENRIQMEVHGREFLLDAESLSFIETRTAAFDAEKLRQLLIDQGIEDDQATKLVDDKPLESADRSVLVFDNDSQDFVFQPNTGTLNLIGAAGKAAELYSFSPDQLKLAFVDANQLHVFNIKDSTASKLQTDDAGPGVSLGKLDWVYQEELYGRGNYKAYWWSPDSARIACLRLDEANVKSYTISDQIPVRGEDQFLNYPKAGDPNPQVSAWIFDCGKEEEGREIDLSHYGDTQMLISNVAWNPDGSRLFVQVQDRVQTWLDLVAVDAVSSQTTVLFRDQTPAWIESPGDPHWLADDSFLWLSPRNGHRHLYQYQADGTLKAQLTDGEWQIQAILEVDRDDGTVYFSAVRENPHDLDAWRLELSSGQIQRITSESGTHNLSFSDDQRYFIDSFDSATEPTEHRLYSSDGTFLRRLSASSDDRWDYVNIAKPEFLTVPSTGSQPLDAMIIRPPNFDPTKKYPVLVHTYAGPQAPQVRNRFGGSWQLWHQALAEAGYVIWKCDNRSASHRSSKHVWPVHRKLGKNELADIEQGVQWLKQQPWVDGQRIGIWGWSYGGYMTAFALTHSQSFKIGIAGAPVTDWRNYDSIYTERLMGLPADNEAGYDESSVVKAAGNLSGRLLLIHGAIDDNVHLSNTMQLALSLQKAGKQFDLMLYPQSRHAVHDEEQARHLRQLMYNFVVENL